MKKFQVAIVGINSIFGGTSALLLKQSPFIKCLKLYDQKNIEAAVDLCSINTQCKVKMFLGNEQLENAFEEADIILISDEANEAMMSGDSHLMTTAGNYRSYAKAIAQASPHAIIVVASTPINSLLPIMSQLLVKEGCYNYNKVMGSTLVDTIRASSILASHLNLDPKEVVLPVIGGSSERTRVPVFSQSRPYFSLKKDEKTDLIMNIRRGDAQVLANKGTPEVLNRAYSTVRFLNSIMAGLRGAPDVTDITLCRTDLVPGVDYFSLPVIFGKEGIVRRFGVPKTTEAEDEMVEEAIKYVKKDTDKAAYIVRGAMELPEQKYLSSNERASSQKEIFDLYVKCLPKPVNNKQDSMSKKSTSYSFNNLVKEGPSINHTALPVAGVPFRRLASNKLKNVVSEDSFLKSTGFFTSPLQNPILILEPMGCPSSPQNSNDHSEIADTEIGDPDSEAHYILHEQNLAITGRGESFLDNSGHKNISMTPTRKSPIFSNDISRAKMIDPIAKLKEKMVDKDLRENANSVSKSSKLSGRCENQHITETDPDEDSYLEVAEFDAIQPGIHVSRDVEDEIEEDVTFEKERFGHADGDDYFEQQADNTKKASSFVYDIRSDRGLPVYNSYNHKAQTPSATIDDKYGSQEVVVDDSKYHKMSKDEKYRKLVSRLFRKLDGLNQGMYIPLKSSESNSLSRCKQSFTESAVRSTSHSICSGQLYQSKPPFKVKLSEPAFDGENDYYEKNSYFKKARIPAPKIKSFVNQSTRNAASCSSLRKRPVLVHEDEIKEKEETMHVVCPKCQNKINYTPDKNVGASKSKTPEKKLPDPPKERESVAETKKEVEVKKINISYYGPRPDYCRTYYRREDGRGEITATASLPVLNANTPRESELQEERLRKLKEKINQKLIPLLNGKNQVSTDVSVSFDNSGSNSTSRSGRTDSYEPLHCEQRHSKENKSAVGTPFVVVKEAVVSNTSQNENGRDVENVAGTSGTKWEGIPFVVKKNNEINYRKRKEESADSSVNPKQREQQRSLRTTNKLQLLGSNNEVNIEPEVEEKTVEAKGSEKLVKDIKKKLLKKEIVDLKSEDVQCYIQGRIKDNFERSQQQKTADSSNKEMDEGSSNVELLEKPKQSAVFSGRNIKVELDGSVDSGAQASCQYQPNQAVAAGSFKPASTANSKNSDTVASKCDESKTDGNVAISSTEPVDESRVSEVSTESGEEKQVGRSKSADASSAECGKLEDRRIEKSSVKGTTDQNVNTLNHSESKILRTSLVTSSDSRSKPNPLINLVVGTPKCANKLQLLVQARELKLNNDKSGSIEGKLQNVWEQTLNVNATLTRSTGRSLRSERRKGSDGVVSKKSAAVQIAQSNNIRKPPSFKVKLKAPMKNTNILEGLTFPARTPKKKPTHNLLKELASSAAQKESLQMVDAVAKKPVRRRRSLDPSNQINLYKKGIKQANSFANGIFGVRKEEYARDDEKLAKLASDVIMKRRLTRPQTEACKWNLDSSESQPDIKIQKQKRSSSSSSVRNLRNQWADYGITKENQRETRIQKSADEVLSKLISMPQVRYQMEHLDPPLGSMEVQPGLATLNYASIGSKFPTADNSWESVLFNEYIRSNLLPSLKDTRETFHFEERPS